MKNPFDMMLFPRPTSKAGVFLIRVEIGMCRVHFAFRGTKIQGENAPSLALLSGMFQLHY